MNTYKVKVGKKSKKYPEGTTFEEIAKDFKDDFTSDIAIAIFNGKMKELAKKLDADGVIEFLDVKDGTGYRTFKRTAVLMFMKACSDVIGEDKINKIKLEFSVNTGYYFSCDGDFKVTSALAKKLEKRMRELSDNSTPILKSTKPVEEAGKIFAAQGMEDKLKLIKYRKSSVINLYELDGYYDYYYGYMLPNCGYVKLFEVLKYKEGIILNLPRRTAPDVLEEFVPLEKVFETMMTATRWGDMLGIDTVGDLNDCICSGDIDDMVLVQEALQERRISEIAKDIAKRKGVKFIMIAGPSSSGKTSFSHRLSVQLRTLGLKPHPIAVDDYFVNRADTPLDENGNYNFECLEAIDTKLFNSDMNKLLSGKRVEIPTFNFKIGAREYKGNFKQLGPDDVLVIEGIHALNDKMSSTLPVESKYKIYISALTTLNIDEHNCIPTTDARLLRRMVRDYRTRGASAKRTIGMWPSVRRGEEENIFPFQETADAMFNSAQIYEIAALKAIAEPILYQVKPEDPEYFEAKRLLKLLEYFLCMDTTNLPKNSIVREFVGGSCFNV
ncbi:MAG: nucleoside kinase [Lachnospiraceae bacterium]|nr:nucleoside kinase [Lachnospiraceae bacterium]